MQPFTLFIEHLRVIGHSHALNKQEYGTCVPSAVNSVALEYLDLDVVRYDDVSSCRYAR